MQRIPKARFVSNPCRLRYFGQEIVIYREDLMGRLLRNLVLVKKTADEGADMKRYVSFINSDLLLTSPACPDCARPSPPLSPATKRPPDTMGV